MTRKKCLRPARRIDGVCGINISLLRSGPSVVIEFYCPECKKYLSTPDDKAGRRAKCPSCGTAITIPQFSEAIDRSSPPPTLPDGDTGFDEEDLGNPPADYADGEGTPLENAPGPRPERRRHAITVGTVFEVSWDVFNRNALSIIGAFILVNVLNVVASVLGNLAEEQLKGQNAEAFKLMIVGFQGLFVQYTTMAGYNLYLLNIATGRHASYLDIFSASRYFLRVLGAAILVSILVFIGMLLFIIPGIYTALMILPYIHIIIAEDVGPIESIRRCSVYTKGNKLALFGTMFLAGIIGFSGILALGVGLLYTVPLASMFLTIAYLQMTGQHIATGKK